MNCSIFYHTSISTMVVIEIFWHKQTYEMGALVRIKINFSGLPIKSLSLNTYCTDLVTFTSTHYLTSYLLKRYIQRLFVIPFAFFYKLLFFYLLLIFDSVRHAFSILIKPLQFDSFFQLIYIFMIQWFSSDDGLKFQPMHHCELESINSITHTHIFF